MYTQFETHDRKIYTSYRLESYTFASHFHSKIELAHCFSGEQKVKIGDEVYTLHEGDTVVIFPNVVHEYIEVKGEFENSTASIALISETSFFSNLIPEIMTHIPATPIVRSNEVSEKVRMAFREMVDVDNVAALAGWTFIILSELVRKDRLVPVKETDGFRLAPSLVDYINGNFRKQLTIKVLSREFGYSESYIAHIFCDQLKIPFRTYLGDVRSKYAANLMKTTGKSLTEIAYECGYENVNTFCRCFKRSYGVTPSVYKKQDLS